MRKFTDCNIIAVLGEIVRHHTECCQSNFEIDKKIFSKAAASSEPKDKRLLWLSRQNGTLCVSEYDAFLKNTYAHTRWTGYGGLAQDFVIAYAVEIKESRGQTFYGDLYELDFTAHRRKIMDAALPVTSMEITYKNGDRKTVAYNYDFYSFVNNKNVLSVKYLPSDLEKWETLLQDEQNERQASHYYPWDLNKLRLEYGDKPTFSIYQLKSTKKDLLFEQYASLEYKGIIPRIDSYDLVYIGEDTADSSLNEIYERFNIDRPSDFCGHSLSMSDVIVKSDGKQSTAYYVDFYGFQLLPNFFNESAENKKGMEM